MPTRSYVCARFRVLHFLPWTLGLLFPLSPLCLNAQESEHKRPSSVEDAIRMVRIAGHLANLSYAGALTDDFAYFSSDRKQFVLVLKKGNLEKNTNEYSLLSFRTSEVFSSPQPRTLVTMSSSSNREGITDVAWLSDNETVVFRGENPGESSQLYSVNSKTGIARKLTNHATNIVEFSADASGRTIVFAAEKPAQPVLTDAAKHEGVTVEREDMPELLAGERIDQNRELYVLETKTGATRALPIPPEFKGRPLGVLNVSLSPDGSQLVVSLNLTEVPARWHEYREPTLARVTASVLPPNSPSWVFRYLVIDTASGHARILFNGPLSYHGSQVVWGQDSRSLILTGVFLPIDQAAGNAKNLSTPATVAVDLETLRYTKLSDEELHFVREGKSGALLVFETRQLSSSKVPPERRYFRKEEGRWLSMEAPAEQDPVVEVTTKQDLNTPPTIVVSDHGSVRRTATLLDPNPQLREIEFGKVQEILFSGAMQKEVHAGLYFPVGYVPGKKYPLVVQTHGFDPKSFWIDGSFTTAFAAQALAGRGFLVLQVPDTHLGGGTPDEAPNMAETLERAVEYVDRLGCLDRDRLGIIGFSRTGLYAHYLLTRSRLHFGAAVIADGSDGGYSQYLQFLNAKQYTASDSEAVNGGMPFGSGLLYWLRRSPEFSLDLIHTPVLFQVSSPQILPSMWAPFVGLRRLGKPVELLYFPEGTHIMEKPWDRLASQGTSVDWFAFWLKGEEDADPSKRDKYKRWKELRALEGRERAEIQ